MSAAASEIGIAKPRPWASVETAVLMPMTRPFASSSGPPLLPGLIAASVWSRLVRVSGRPVASSWTVIVRPVAGQDALGHGLGEGPERAADGDDRGTDRGGRRVADDRRLQATGIDLDQREVRVVRLLGRWSRGTAGRRPVPRSATGCLPRRAGWSGCSRRPSGSRLSRRRSTGSGRSRRARRTPSEVMVTTESRTDGDDRGQLGGARCRRGTRGRDGGWRARGCAGGVDGANGPATSAAVPPAARTADRIAAMTTVVGPRREPPVRRGAEAVHRRRDGGRCHGRRRCRRPGRKPRSEPAPRRDAGSAQDSGSARQGLRRRGSAAQAGSRHRARTSEAPIVLEVAWVLRLRPFRAPLLRTT